MTRFAKAAHAQGFKTQGNWIVGGSDPVADAHAQNLVGKTVTKRGIFGGETTGIVISAEGQHVTIRVTANTDRYVKGDTHRFNQTDAVLT